MTCSTVLMMVGPPGEPVTRTILPSLKTMVGVIEESGRLPGKMALASPFEWWNKRAERSAQKVRSDFLTARFLHSSTVSRLDAWSQLR